MELAWGMVCPADGLDSKLAGGQNQIFAQRREDCAASLFEGVHPMGVKITASHFNDGDADMTAWCVEKSTRVVVALAGTIDRLRHLGVFDDDGVRANLYEALRNAMKLWALSTPRGQSFDDADVEAIFERGTEGFEEIRARYDSAALRAPAGTA